MVPIRPFTDPPSVTASYRTQIQQGKSAPTTAESTTENSTTNLPMNTKERGGRGSISTIDQAPASAGPSRILCHQDSGLRLSPPEEEPVIELPPVYTPG